MVHEGARRTRKRGLKATLDMLAPEFRKAVHNQVKVYERLGAKYAVVGGLAVGVYSEPRSTSDVDFLTDDNVFDATQSKLIKCFVSGVPLSYGDVRVDTLSVDDRYRELYERAIEEAVDSDEPGVKVVTAESLAMMKLHAFRPKDRNDLLAMFEADSVDMDALSEMIDGEDELETRLDKLLEEEEGE